MAILPTQPDKYPKPGLQRGIEQYVIRLFVNTYRVKTRGGNHGHLLVVVSQHRWSRLGKRPIGHHFQKHTLATSAEKFSVYLQTLYFTLWHNALYIDLLGT